MEIPINHSTDIGKIDFVHMTFIPKNNIKPVGQKPYRLPLNTMPDLEKN